MARLVPRGAPFPVAICARHVHLCAAHVEALFGKGHSLRPLAPLTQADEFACVETVTVRGPGGKLLDVRVVGPVRQRTQVEVSLRDQARLGIEGGLRLSSKVEGSLGCTLEGPKGMVVLAEGLLNAMRHLHAPPAEATRLGLVDDTTVAVSVSGERARVLSDVLVRVREGARLELHVDTEEAASVELGPDTVAYLVEEEAA